MAKNIFTELQELANLHFIRIFLSLSQNSPVMKSFQLSHTGPFLPFFLEPKQLFSGRAKLAPKTGLYFTHRKGPILGAETNPFDL